jgi:hypothetical protein
LLHHYALGVPTGGTLKNRGVPSPATIDSTGSVLQFDRLIHNMVIENKHGHDLDYSFYNLMGHHMRVQRR